MSFENAFSDGPVFIPYLATGDPDYESLLEYIEALERGDADIIGLGLPFSEPIAEGPTIQNAIVRSLEGGMTPTRSFEFVEDLGMLVLLVCMTYYGLIYRYGDGPGPRPSVEKAAEIGIEGFVVPDLPAEEAGPFREACDEFDLDLMFIVASTAHGEHLGRIMEQVSGYVYVQARLGTTGAQSSISDQTGSSLERLTDYDAPKTVGFRISDGDHTEYIATSGADGVIIGSALVDIVVEDHENGGDAETVADRLETLARELGDGAVAGASQRPPHPEHT